MSNILRVPTLPPGSIHLWTRAPRQGDAILAQCSGDVARFVVARNRDGTKCDRYDVSSCDLVNVSTVGDRDYPIMEYNDTVQGFMVQRLAGNQDTGPCDRPVRTEEELAESREFDASRDKDIARVGCRDASARHDGEDDSPMPGVGHTTPWLAAGTSTLSCASSGSDRGETGDPCAALAASEEMTHDALVEVAEGDGASAKKKRKGAELDRTEQTMSVLTLNNSCTARTVWLEYIGHDGRGGLRLRELETQAKWRSGPEHKVANRRFTEKYFLYREIAKTYAENGSDIVAAIGALQQRKDEQKSWSSLLKLLTAEQPTEGRLTETVRYKLTGLLERMDVQAGIHALTAAP
ncbi:hypothetical protein AB1Y20_015015 [Prymnesium parvum]|uniref:Uncharacterized protein n=1 Tax=Prymnesium parvum TaxID=97485 RepID=A0AB34JYW1_PRYPA|mmetsp:Transcript_35075/g.87353  ORF Transcript_35075/g.87353 Transcript_35075/m.87353 type:complete len:350 (+) Transcript_35075:88-1137(+)